MAFNPDKCLKFTAFKPVSLSLGTSKVDGSHYYFSKDGVTWYPDNENLEVGESVYCKGTNYPSAEPDNYRRLAIGGPDTKGSLKISGSIMSLVDDGAGEQLTITQEYAFAELFTVDASCADISELLLPATTLAPYCYFNMFKQSSSIISIPENLLPATTLADGCYYGMFSQCAGLTSIPEQLLPATNLAPQCYRQMFYSCKGLTSIPENLLPVTQLSALCYAGMFWNCSGLAAIPENLLPATNLTEGCYKWMFEGCRSLTSIPENLLPATILADSCYSCMFHNCPGLTTIPDNLLPANTLESACYDSMFAYCSNLSRITANFSDWTVSSGDPPTSNWLTDVSSEGVFICSKKLPVEHGASRIPEGWTVQYFPTRTPGSVTFLNKLKVGGRVM